MSDATAAFVFLVFVLIFLGLVAAASRANRIKQQRETNARLARIEAMLEGRQDRPQQVDGGYLTKDD